MISQRQDTNDGMPPMGNAARPLDVPDVTRRILQQRVGRYPDTGPSLAPLGNARFRLDVSRVRVAFAHIHPGQAGEAVRRVQAFVRPRGAQVQWTVLPTRPGETELPAALRAERFVLADDLLLMAHAGQVAAPLNPEVSVAPIDTWQAMWTYEYGSRQSFFDEPQPAHEIVTHRARERWREQEQGWCRYFAAIWRGRVAGGAYVSMFEDIPTIMGVYTVAAARHHGIATALLARAIDEGTVPGRDITCLYVKHGNPAERLYRSLGFVPLLDEHMYQWTPGQ